MYNFFKNSKITSLLKVISVVVGLISQSSPSVCQRALPFWAGQFLVLWNCPKHCKRFSIPGLYSLSVSACSFPNLRQLKMTLHISKSPRQAIPSTESHWLPEALSSMNFKAAIDFLNSLCYSTTAVYSTFTSSACSLFPTSPQKFSLK